jgi:cytochrome c biogenesis factor
MKQLRTKRLALSERICGVILFLIALMLILTLLDYPPFSEATMLGRVIRGSAFDRTRTSITVILDLFGGVLLWWIARNPLSHLRTLDLLVLAFFINATSALLFTPWLSSRWSDVLHGLGIVLVSSLLFIGLRWFRPHSVRRRDLSGDPLDSV